MTADPAAEPGFDLRAFGRRVALARNGAGLTQSELAELVDRTRASIAGIEGGHSATTLPQLAVLAGALGVSVDWLMTGRIGDVPTELVLQLRRFRAGWAHVLDGNRGLGWPEQATCVEMPRAFVAELDQVLDAIDPKEAPDGREAAG